MVERTKISDQILITQGIKIADLQKAIVQYDLEDDREYKKLIQQFKTEKLMEESKLSEAQEEEVKKVCAEASSEVGDTNLNDQGCIEFEVYLAITRLIVKLQVRLEKLTNDEYKDERRAAIKTGNL